MAKIKTIKTAPEIISIDVIFVDRKFIDTTTNQPVRFMNNSKAKVLILSDRLIGAEVSGLGSPKNSIAKEQEIKNAVNIEKYHKILPANTFLYFKIKNKIFKIELLEDLYFFKRKESVEIRQFGVFECQCKVLEVEQTIVGNSLSEIYRLAFVKTFYNEGAPSVNTFDRFFIEFHNMKDKSKSLRAILDAVKW